MKPAIITDFGQYASLRAEARAQTPEAIEKTARQFEGLLLQQMLKSMRQASPGDALLGGGQMGFYQDMFDQQLSAQLSGQSGIGIAKLLVRQLQQQAGSSTDSAAPQAAAMALPLRPAVAAAGAATEPAAPLAAAAAAAGDADFRPGSPREFVAALWPQAERAAKALGIPARVLVAQAALETGWGRHQIRHADGRSSFNLFGIKANAGWEGARVQAGTQEFEDGRFVPQKAGFRAYGSIAEAFDDYARFLRENPRYADALRHEGSAQRYVTGLQQAGYATDPGYAQKILRIAYGPTLQAAISSTRTVSA